MSIVEQRPPQTPAGDAEPRAGTTSGSRRRRGNHSSRPTTIVVPHPDDEALLFGGLLTTLRRPRDSLRRDRRDRWRGCVRRCRRAKRSRHAGDTSRTRPSTSSGSTRHASAASVCPTATSTVLDALDEGHRRVWQSRDGRPMAARPPLRPRSVRARCARPLPSSARHVLRGHVLGVASHLRRGVGRR